MNQFALLGLFCARLRRLRPLGDFWMTLRWVVRTNDGAVHRKSPRTIAGAARRRPRNCDAILLYGLGHPGFTVDEDLRRVVTRHELLPANARYAELQSLGDGAIASATREETAHHANELPALIVEVGKRDCGATPRCEGCPLQPFLLTRIRNRYTETHPSLERKLE